MAFVLSGNSITDLVVYLTPIGKKNFLMGRNFTINQFALGDSDINYLNTELIPIGQVPDISGDGIGCINSIADGINIKNFIEKDGLPVPTAYITPLSEISVLGDDDFSFKLALNSPFSKKIKFRFNIEINVEIPSFSNYLSHIEYKSNQYSLDDFNNLDFYFNIGEISTDEITLVFQNSILQNDIERQIIITIDIEPNDNLELVSELIIERYNEVVPQPNIVNVTSLLQNNGRFFFNVQLEELKYELPLKYRVFGFNQLQKDIVNETTHTLSNLNDEGYVAGTYNIIVEDNNGKTDSFFVTTPVSISATLSIPTNKSFEIVVNGLTTGFSYVIFKKNETSVSEFTRGTIPNSNSGLINNINIENGTYYAVITNSSNTVTSNEVIFEVKQINPSLSDAGFEQNIRTIKYFVAASNLTTLGNHRLDVFVSLDGINYQFLETKSFTFIGNYTFLGTTVSTTNFTLTYFKFILTASYGLTSNEVIIVYRPDVIDLTDTIPSNSGSNTGSNGCFSYNTLVTTENNGQILIKDIKIGDRLKSFSIDGLIDSDLFEEYSKWETSNFTLLTSMCSVISKNTKKIPFYYEINENIKVSHDHAFLVKRLDKYKFLQAKSIVKGDYLVNNAGSLILVNKNIRVNRVLDVISIDVDNSNLYIVNNMIVHNKRIFDNDILNQIEAKI